MILYVSTRTRAVWRLPKQGQITQICSQVDPVTLLADSLYDSSKVPKRSTLRRQAWEERNE